MKKAGMALLALLMLLAGCASGFHRNEAVHVYGYDENSAAAKEFAVYSALLRGKLCSA